jgi:hypothetical protein
MLSRLQSAAGVATHKGKPVHVLGTVLSLDIYKWLLIHAPLMATAKELDVQDIFREEISICREMVELLPAKIDRMHYLGEGNSSFAQF